MVRNGFRNHPQYVFKGKPEGKDPFWGAVRPVPGAPCFGTRGRGAWQGRCRPRDPQCDSLFPPGDRAEETPDLYSVGPLRDPGKKERTFSAMEGGNQQEETKI